MKSAVCSLAAIFGSMFLLACGAAAADTESTSASPADVQAIRHVLSLAAMPAGDAAPLKASLGQAIDKIGDAALRQRIAALLPELQTAAERHARSSAVVASLKTMNGLSETSHGGPAWLRVLAGDESMQVFDHLVLVDLNERKNPHAKDYKLNSAINDEWLSQLIGLTDIRRLDIANVAIHGPGLKYVGTLTNLESLNLTLTPVTDEYLEHLAGLTQLKILSLASAECTGTGCKYLGKLTHLENLNMHHTPVNDEGLKEICTLGSLERLEVVHTFFTDAGAMHFANLKSIQRLQIGSRKATGASVGYLRGLPKLRELDLHDLNNGSEAVQLASEIPTLTVLRVYLGGLTDNDLKSIEKLTNLEELVIEGAKLSDAGIESLTVLTKLKKLNLGAGKISPAALEKLKAGLPALHIGA